MLEWIFVFIIAGQEVPASEPISIATCLRMRALAPNVQTKCVRAKPVTGGAA